jgi:hypothetical protein
MNAWFLYVKQNLLFNIKLVMAFGLWKKIKAGFQKAGKWIKDKIVMPVYNKVIKPVGKFIGGIIAPAVSKVATTVAPALGAINPAYGGIAAGVAAGAEAVSRVIQNPKDELQPLLRNKAI